MSDKQFVEGMRFNTPKQNAPAYIKAHISIDMSKFVEWAAAHQDDRGWLNIDVKESKGGKLYCELNTWKPERQRTTTAREDREFDRNFDQSPPPMRGINDPEHERIRPEDIPF